MFTSFYRIWLSLPLKIIPKYCPSQFPECFPGIICKLCVKSHSSTRRTPNFQVENQKTSSAHHLHVQCRPELSELRRRVLYTAKTRMRVFLDSSKCARFCHCYSSSQVLFCLVLSNKTKEFNGLTTNTKLA